MSDSGEQRAQAEAQAQRATRAADRRKQAARWPIQKYSLGEEPLIDSRDRRTLDERVQAVFELSRRAYEISNQEPPRYTRSTMPGRLWTRHG